MKTKFFFALFFLCGWTFSMAQTPPTFSVKGVVTDSAGVNLRQASITVLKQPNNLLNGFGFTNASGAFEVKNVKAGDYVLQVTYVGKQTLRKPFKMEAQDVDLGKLVLYNKVTEVASATITADRSPITVKKDTLEYDAKAFATRPNANVEELLKKLPGVEVDKDGKITAAGKEVTKIKIDGKDFFGSDPKMASRNLDANIVDKVQVVDERSDMSRFTGIDDGDRERVINLALRQDKKKGYFGKVTAGFGSEERYQESLTANRFNQKMQLALVGNFNNNNSENFTRGEGMAVQFSGGGGGGGQQGGRPGLSTAQSGGLNFSYDFSKKLQLNSSYNLNRLENIQDRVSNQQQLLGANNSFRTAQTSFQNNLNLNHRVNARVNYKPNDKRESILRANIGFSNSELKYNSEQKTYNATDALRNEGTRKQTSESDGINGQAQWTYRMKLGKVGRNLVLNAQGSDNSTDQSTLLNTLDQYYTGAPNLVVNQNQINNSTVWNYQGTATYTEPLNLSTLLELNYTLRNNNNDQDRQVYDILASGGSVKNTQLSNLYENQYLYHLVGSKINYRAEKFNVNVGAKVQKSSLEGISQNNAPITRNSLNILPEANFNYTSAQRANLTLNYNSRVREPSVRELQPTADNRNPQNVYIGNPNLDNEFSHNVSANFFKFDMFTQTNMMAFISGSYTLDKIINSSVIDGTTFTQTTTPLNSDKQDWSLMAFGNYGRPIRPLKIKFSLSLNSVYNKGFTLINQALNQTTTQIMGGGLTIDNIRKETFDLRVGTRLNQNTSKYSLNKEQNRSYLTPSYLAELSLYLGKDKEWTISADATHTQYPATSLGASQKQTIVEAGVSRNMFKNKGIFEIMGYDLLNQNLGLTRSESSSFISEESVNTLGRYVIARFTYNFRVFGK